MIDDNVLPFVTLRVDQMATRINYALELHHAEVREYIAAKVKEEVASFLPKLNFEIKRLTHEALLKKAERYFDDTEVALNLTNLVDGLMDKVMSDLTENP